MKRIGNVWHEIISFDNLLSAYQKARKGKSTRKDVAWFDLELEKELLRLQDKLKNRTWSPSKYRLFTI